MFFIYQGSVNLILQSDIYLYGFSFLTSLVQVLIFCGLGKVLFNVKNSDQYIPTLIVATLSFSCSTIISMPIVLVATISIITTFFLMRVTKTGFRNRIIGTTICIFVAAISELIAELFISQICKSSNLITLKNLAVIVSFLFQGFFLTMISQFKSIRVHNIGLFWYLFFPIPLLSCTILSIIFSLSRVKVLIYISILFILGINITFFVTVYYFQKFIEKVRRLNEKNMEETMLIQKYTNRLESFKEQRKLIHDFRKYLNTIFMFIEEGKYLEALELIKELTYEPPNMFEVRSGNRIVDIQLSSFLNKIGMTIDDLNVQMSLDPDIEKISSRDLSIILGNLFDNIAYYADTTRNKSIEITIIYTREKFIVKTKNLIDTDKNRNSIRTSQHFGLGQELIREVIRKYNGEFITDKQDKFFSSYLIIFF
ncbi:GHKL domain-containing protein [Lactiplantibacillus plantarum]